MNAKTNETLQAVWIALYVARLKAREVLTTTDDCDLYERKNRQKYIAISAMIGDVQHFVAGLMQKK